jgi:PPE-repeat protein
VLSAPFDITSQCGDSKNPRSIEETSVLARARINGSTTPVFEEISGFFPAQFGANASVPVMDFGSLPPEINSACMCAGPGSGPMLAAAAAWDALAAELLTTTAGYESVTAELTSGPWMGQASAAMTRAVARYVVWLYVTADQAEQTAIQARAAASAYEAARVAIVPMSAIATNRVQLMALVATNVLGQNTPAIATTEAHYGEMWAQDATAMYGYAASSATASKVTPFTPPPAITNSAGAATQAIAVGQAGGNSAAAHVQDTVSIGDRLISAVPQRLQALASPLSMLSSLDDSLGGHARTMVSAASFIAGVVGLGRGTSAADIPAAPVVQAAGSGVSRWEPKGLSGLGAAGGGAAPAGVGQATSVGALSVPQSWFAAAPAASPVAATMAGTGWSAEPTVWHAGMPIMPITRTAGYGAGRLAGGSRFALRPNSSARSPVGG